MDDFSRRPKTKTRKKQVEYSYRFEDVGAEELLAQFPLPRYFQIHFSHIHENCEQTKQQVDELKQSIKLVEQKLDRILDAMMQEQL